MNIVHVIHSLDPRSGGPSNALYSLSAVQIGMGHSVRIIATDRQSTHPWIQSKTFQEIINDRVPKNLKSLKVIPSYGRHRPWSRYGWSPACKSIIRSELLDTTKEGKCFVHIHGLFSQITEVAASISTSLKIPYAIRPTGALHPATITKGSANLKQLFIQFWLKKSMASASFIHATSRMEKDAMVNLNWNPNVLEIPLGVRIPEWKPEHFQSLFAEKFPTLKGKPFLFCLSRIHPIKRLELAIQAFTEFNAKYPSFHLVIAGSETPYQKTLEALADRLGIRDNIHFIGFIEGEIKSGAYFSAKGFLQTSEHENFGQTVMEALAHGLPVVCTSGVATSVQVKQSNGGTVIQNDVPEEIAEALMDLSQKNLLGSQQRLSDWTATHYSWEAAASQLDKAFETYSRS